MRSMREENDALIDELEGKVEQVSRAAGSINTEVKTSMDLLRSVVSLTLPIDPDLFQPCSPDRHFVLRFVILVCSVKGWERPTRACLQLPRRYHR